MSTKYPGGIITKNYVAPTPSSASGIWTLEQQEQAQQAGLWPFGGPFNYIEDVFSTWLYDGNGSTQTITNGIDLSTKGGLVWVKGRSSASPQNNHQLIDTVRGVGNSLITNLADAEYNFFSNGSVGAFNTNGFSLNGSGSAGNRVNQSSQTYCSWTFREQPKFFDIVTYTGNGVSGRAIPHSLGSVPGCIMVKATSTTGSWVVYHRKLDATNPQNYWIELNNSAARQNDSVWGGSQPTSTDFTVSGNFYLTNDTGVTYVAYLFAHDAGGFGLTGTDNVISCGSFTNNGSGASSVTLGYEPQWLLIKNADASENWLLADNMRSMAITGDTYLLLPSSTTSEYTNIGLFVKPNATGFEIQNLNASQKYIYIAIRRGPMKVPTDATKVYNTVTANAPSTPTTITFDTTLNGGDWGWSTNLNNANRAFGGTTGFDRLRGSLYLFTNTNGAEANSAGQGFSGQTSYIRSFGSGDVAGHFFKRAPGYFDEVCVTGTGSALTTTHNLGAVPEFMIVKSRNVAEQWLIYHSALGNTKFLYFTTGTPITSSLGWNDTSPTSTQLTIGAGWSGSGVTLVAYLFATCAGVSKVGSYTGNGGTQAIACGFTGGARFVLIKRTDSTGDWYVYDTARGMSTLTDPYLLLNSTAAQSATLGSVTTTTGGFTVNAAVLAAINTNAASYIFLAIA